MDFFIQFGYCGIFLASFLAATILPLSSEVVLSVLIVAGLDPWLCLIYATLGNWLGGLSGYGLGWLGKWHWLEKVFSVKQEKVFTYKKKIDRFGGMYAFFTWLPVVGDIIAVALGFFRVPILQTSVFMLAGKLFRYLVWAWLTVRLTGF